MGRAGDLAGRRAWFRWAVGVAALALASTACTGASSSSSPASSAATGATQTPRTAPPVATRPTFTTASCPAGHEAESVPGIRCGTVDLPLRHGQPDGPTVKLAVAVLPVTGANPVRDPVVYLSGGPGDDAFNALPKWKDHPLRSQREVVIIGQRGTATSQPSLDCPEMTKQQIDDLHLPPDDPTLRADELRAMTSCHDRLTRAGVDLAAFNNVENATDIADVRMALGYEQWNVVGVSHGTRVALALLRDHPDGVRSVVLSSPLPYGSDRTMSEVARTTYAFDALEKGCTKDIACNAGHPDLGRRLPALFRELEAHPIELHGTTKAGDPVTVTVDGDRAVIAVFAAMYDIDLLPALPAFIDLFEKRQVDFLGQTFVDEFEQRQNALGLAQSIRCAEVPAELRDAPPTPAVGVDPFVARAQAYDDDLAACAAWNVPSLPAADRASTTSDVPALIVTTTYDPITPAPLGDLAAVGLSNATKVNIEANGHAPLFNSCAAPIITTWIDELDRASAQNACATTPVAWR